MSKVVTVLIIIGSVLGATSENCNWKHDFRCKYRFFGDNVIELKFENQGDKDLYVADYSKTRSGTLSGPSDTIQIRFFLKASYVDGPMISLGSRLVPSKDSLLLTLKTIKEYNGIRVEYSPNPADGKIQICECKRW